MQKGIQTSYLIYLLPRLRQWTAYVPLEMMMMFSIKINFVQKEVQRSLLEVLPPFLRALISLTLGGSPPVGMVTKDSSSRETKPKPFENRLDDDEAFNATGRVETWSFKKMRAQCCLG